MRKVIKKVNIKKIKKNNLLLNLPLLQGRHQNQGLDRNLNRKKLKNKKMKIMILQMID